MYILAQPPIIAKIAMNQGHATRVRLEGTHARLAGDSIQVVAVARWAAHIRLTLPVCLQLPI